jgi:ABC-type spermidine/putrescine transport system permease subunit I
VTTEVVQSPERRPAILNRIAGRPLRRSNVFTWLGLPALVFMILVFLVPLIVIIDISLASPSPHNFVAAWQDGIFRRSLWITVEMALGVTVICLLVSYPYAYVLARGGKIMRGILLGALLLSFWTSSLVRTYAWEILLNNVGLINRALINLGVISSPIQLIHNQFAVYLTMSQILAPFTILTIYSSLRSISPDLERAAQVMGARPSVAFFRVTVPLTLPGAVAGGILVFVIALGFYITPSIVAASDTLYLGSAIVLQLNVFLHTGVASAEAVIMLAVVTIVLAIAARFVSIGRILGLNRGARQ